MSETLLTSQIRPRWQDHPLFSEGFRVFFPLAALSALGLILYWGLTLSGVWAGFGAGPDPLMLHRYDMIFGFLVAAMIGFIGTAVPAWSSTPKLAGAELAGMGALWIAGRLAFWLQDSLPALLVFGLQTILLVWVAWRIFPPLWQTKMRHLMWPVSLLIAAQIMTSLSFLSEDPITLLGLGSGLDLSFDNGLMLAEGAFAIMVLTALAPVSTVIVNKSLEARTDGVKFIARPPIRRAAMVCIGLFTFAKIAGLSDALQGWLGLAAGAAILNILQDWHMRKALSFSFARPLYLIYWFLALGFGLQAGSLLDVLPQEALVAGRHMMFIGGFTLATLMVLIIAGLRHAGRALDMKPVLILAICSLIASCLLRSLAPLLIPQIDWMVPAWMAFAACFAAYLVHFLPIFFRENSND